MPPKISCIRHAQGYHNLNRANHSIHDPQLTPFGEEQCALLATEFPHRDSVDLIVCSPMHRTLFTSLLTFQSIIAGRNVRIIALPELQEVMDSPCDTGTDIAILQQEMDTYKDIIDFSHVKVGWEVKTAFATSDSAVKLRAQAARVWLRARPEKHIAVVTHGGFLHHFTGDWSDFKKRAGKSTRAVGLSSHDVQGTGWKNCEYRTFTFKDQGRTARLEETAESLAQRIDGSVASKATVGPIVEVEVDADNCVALRSCGESDDQREDCL